MKKRLFFLDFVKTVACWAVFTVHFNAETSNMFTLPNQIFPSNIFRGVYLGTFGVSLFFIASGVGLYYSWSNSSDHSLKKFYWKRATALYPMFWIAYIWAAIGSLLKYGKLSSASMAYFPFTIIGMDGNLQAMNLVVGKFYLVGEWFLGCLILMYIVAPLLLFLIDYRPLFTLMLSMVCSYVCLIPSMPAFMHGDYWFMRRLPELVLGMLFAKYIREPNWKTSAVGGVVFVVSMLSKNLILDYVTYDTLICASWFMILAGIAEYVKITPVEKIVSTVSKYMYAIFLCHHAIMYMTVSFFHLDWFQQRDLIVLYIAYIMATAFVSKRLYSAEKSFKAFVAETYHSLVPAKTEK